MPTEVLVESVITLISSELSQCQHAHISKMNTIAHNLVCSSNHLHHFAFLLHSHESIGACTASWASIHMLAQEISLSALQQEQLENFGGQLKL